MKIISDFKDYYDVGMQHGFDPQLPYMRIRKEIKKRQDNSGMMYIGFAGKIYPFFDINSVHFFCSKKPQYIWACEEIPEEFFDEWAKIQNGSRYSARRAKYYYNNAQRLRENLRKRFEETDKLLGLFQKHNTAIFLYKNEHWIVINERLNQFGFQKILPPMEAYQELSMYVGSCMTKPTIEAPPIADKTMAEIKGFDKFSFRKAKK